MSRAEELMRLNRVVAGPALFFALLLSGRPPLQHAFAQVQGNSGDQEPLIRNAGYRNSWCTGLLKETDDRDVVVV